MHICMQLVCMQCTYIVSTREEQRGAGFPPPADFHRAARRRSRLPLRRYGRRPDNACRARYRVYTSPVYKLVQSYSMYSRLYVDMCILDVDTLSMVRFGAGVTG